MVPIKKIEAILIRIRFFEDNKKAVKVISDQLNNVKTWTRREFSFKLSLVLKNVVDPILL